MASLFQKATGLSTAIDYGRGLGALAGRFGKSGFDLPTEQEATFERTFDALQVLENNERQADVARANETSETADGFKFGGIGLVLVLAGAGAWLWFKKRKKV